MANYRLRLLLGILLLLSGGAFGQNIRILSERLLQLGLEDKILVENQLVAAPSNSRQLLLSGMYIDSKAPNQYGNFAAVSFDQGNSWPTVHLFDIPEGADPWGMITKRGTMISTVLGLEELYLYRSENQGKDWFTPLSLGKYHDHQTLLHDPSREITYLISIQGNDIYINHSRDEGKTFPKADRFTFSNLSSNTMTPVLLDDGSLLIAFTTFIRPAINGSRNQGKAEKLRKTLSWAIPYHIDQGFGTPQFICETCETGFPVLAQDPGTAAYKKHLYYVCSSQTDRSIFFHYSDDEGQSWSAGIPIAYYTHQPVKGRNPFTGMPQVAVNQEGTIGVIWQSRVEDPESQCQYLYFSASLDGGQTFLPAQRVSSQLSCMEKEANQWAGKRYKSGGDYTGMTTDEKGHFLIIWPDSRAGISQLYMAKIKVE